MSVKLAPREDELPRGQIANLWRFQQTFSDAKLWISLREPLFLTDKLNHEQD